MDKKLKNLTEAELLEDVNEYIRATWNSFGELCGDNVNEFEKFEKQLEEHREMQKELKEHKKVMEEHVQHVMDRWSEAKILFNSLENCWMKDQDWDWWEVENGYLSFQYGIWGGEKSITVNEKYFIDEKELKDFEEEQRRRSEKEKDVKENREREEYERLKKKFEGGDDADDQD